ncbi:MAG: hypothetical protein J2P48_11090, partial [Alphaproteobacteria bacterium]|nr:hypothetical protein [Alphaproteobacteria bacterium]
TRTIVAIRIDTVEISSNVAEPCRTSVAPKRRLRGFDGPPYGVAESVLDQDDKAAMRSAIGMVPGQLVCTPPRLVASAPLT